MLRRTSSQLLASLGMSVLCAATLSTSGSAVYANEPLRINARGSLTNLGIWLYRTKDGKYSHGDATVGTNETLIMPAPSPPIDGAVAGVLIKRHPFDNLGYPLHIALVEKSFGQLNKIDVIADDHSGIWSHKFGSLAVQEMREPDAFAPTVSFKYSGPFPADGPIPANMQEVYASAKQAMASIENLSGDQKKLDNYIVLFVVVPDRIWVEFGPRFGKGELPHLGCQTQLGRDMVFAYDAQQLQGAPLVFLQCF